MTISIKKHAQRLGPIHALYFIGFCGLIFLSALLHMPLATASTAVLMQMGRPYVIVDTAQDRAFDDRGSVIHPIPGQRFYGQDSQFDGPRPSYIDNGDGTISDNITGLMWQKNPGKKMTYHQAAQKAPSFSLAGYNDWRLPTIKELYSLIHFNGSTGRSASSSIPYIDTRYFAFKYGDSRTERFIDSQYCSSTRYVSTTMNGEPTVFGVNFADGRIKGYGLQSPRRGQKTFYVIYVRGNPEYGKNAFVDNKDGTVTDLATGLMWMKPDSGHLRAGIRKDGTLNWEQALSWADHLEFAGHTDWRLPNAKELQSIVDYTRSPDTTATAAINPVFQCTPITLAHGAMGYGYYWTATTHLDGPSHQSKAIYIAFGEALGYMSFAPRGQGSGRPRHKRRPWEFLPGQRPEMRSNRHGEGEWMDVHGAGAQRSDPKSGNPSRYPYGRGPQGDDIRIYNLARAVRNVL